MKIPDWRWTCTLFCLVCFQPLHPQDPKPSSGPFQPETVLVILERSGGYAGLEERYEIRQDGSIMNDVGANRRMSDTDLRSLRRNLAALHLQPPTEINLRRNMQWVCTDCFLYRIEIIGPQGRLIISMNELEMAGDNQAAALARSIREFVFGFKWH